MSNELVCEHCGCSILSKERKVTVDIHAPELHMFYHFVAFCSWTCAMEWFAWNEYRRERYKIG